jgi:REP element-mobilizing transposase RayT
MSLIDASHKEELRAAGWHSRGYLPHFDGRAIPQFITLRLADSVPGKVIERWQRELDRLELDQDERRITMQRRIERYLDQGYGSCLLGETRIATMVQNSLLHFDGVRYNLFAWVVMPNHSHSLLTRFEDWRLDQLMHSHKSYTAHEANKILERSGQFWMVEYFDRYIRSAKHFQNAVRYIENNPVKAGLCKRPGEWPFSSAWFREHGDTSEE